MEFSKGTSCGGDEQKAFLKSFPLFRTKKPPPPLAAWAPLGLALPFGWSGYIMAYYVNIFKAFAPALPLMGAPLPVRALLAMFHGLPADFLKNSADCLPGLAAGSVVLCLAEHGGHYKRILTVYKS